MVWVACDESGDRDEGFGPVADVHVALLREKTFPSSCANDLGHFCDIIGDVGTRDGDVGVRVHGDVHQEGGVREPRSRVAYVGAGSDGVSTRKVRTLIGFREQVGGIGLHVVSVGVLDFARLVEGLMAV